MSSPKYRVRRATLDDLDQLMNLWHAMNHPVEDLPRRVTEFQVVEDENGKLIAAVGLQIAQKHGRIHSESFADFEVADQLRPLIWDRVRSVAGNHGLLRVWTQEKAPFWSHSGFVKAEPEVLEKLPEAWRGLAGLWLTLKLKDELPEVISADKEFALFMESERQRSERAMQQARALKVFATVVALVLLCLVIAGAVIILLKSPRLQR